jgi:hypothetical protein
MLGATNSIFSQGFTVGWDNIQWGQVALSAGSSMLTSALSQYVGDKLYAPITKLTSGISNSIVRETLNGVLENSATGFIVGTGLSLVTGNDLKTSLKNGGNAAGVGAITGAASGFMKGMAIRSTGRTQRNDPYYLEKLNEARRKYEKKSGNFEFHHLDPKYMGGKNDGTLVKIDAAYHQQITNYFRYLHHYGKGELEFKIRQPKIRNVYMKYPIPY